MDNIHNIRLDIREMVKVETEVAGVVTWAADPPG